MRPLMLKSIPQSIRPLKPLSLGILALPLALAACGDGTDPATTGAVETPGIEAPPAVDPVDPVVVDPAAPPAADDTTLQ